MKIGFIGGGNMGGAILAGYGSADPDNEARIALFDKSEEVCAKTRERFPKMTICSSGRELCSSSDVVILGVKPQVIEGVLSEIAGACTSDKLIISMAAGVDLPFVEKRWRRYSGASAALPYNLDLYLVLNGHSPIKRFVPNLKQKTVENYMGLWQSRDDEISGAESVELYNVYEKNHDPALGEKILLHNSDDILQLSRLLPVIGKSDFHSHGSAGISCRTAYRS